MARIIMRYEPRALLGCWRKARGYKKCIASIMRAFSDMPTAASESDQFSCHQVTGPVVGMADVVIR